MKSISVTKSFKELESALMTSIRKRFTATLRPLRRPRNTSLVPLHPIKVADISTDERFKQCCLNRAAAFGVKSMTFPAISENELDWMNFRSGSDIRLFVWRLNCHTRLIVRRPSRHLKLNVLTSIFFRQANAFAFRNGTASS